MYKFLYHNLYHLKKDESIDYLRRKILVFIQIIAFSIKLSEVLKTITTLAFG